MPRSASSYFQLPRHDGDDDQHHPLSPSTPSSPTHFRRTHSSRTSDLDLSTHLRPRPSMEETSSLLGNPDGPHRSYNTSGPPTPHPRQYSRRHSVTGSVRLSKNHSRANSFAFRVGTRTPRFGQLSAPLSAKTISSLLLDERVWYDQFTSTDWVHDSIADGYRVRELRKRRDIRGRMLAWFDGAQGWILVAIIGIITAAVAYFVDVSETSIFDLKEGYCSDGWYFSKRKCCFKWDSCTPWRPWSEVFKSTNLNGTLIDFFAFLIGVVVLSLASCFLTLLTKTIIPSAVSLSTLDENLGAERGRPRSDETENDRKSSPSPEGSRDEPESSPAMVYYSAAGSGVAEVKVILSGFVLHGYLGVKTLVIKSLALVLSVASGLSLGKEGPYVHIATCVGNIACRLFAKYNHNDGKRREVLSASAASGVAVAFGAPIGGVLFGLEEVSYYFPPKTLFRTFFCCIAAALSLKFLNPYGTGKIVMFEVRYVTDWRIFEIIAFILLGVMGGAAGALFIKASRIWARTFRRIPIIKKWPMLEVFLVALVTGLTSFWNRYTKLAVTELLFELASPCNQNDVTLTGLCPVADEIPRVIRYLCIAFVIKAFLTTITFGIKVPAGIYVPSMVVGGLMGRIVGHCVQYLVIKFPDNFLFDSCPNTSPESCVVPGVYALVAAGATMCGVTRLSVTLSVILFELTGSLDHVLPFSLAVLVSKWTADALEPLSIYDLLTDMNEYPFLDNKVHPVFDSVLGDITPRLRKKRLIDISNSPLVPARELRQKLEYLHMAGELDGGLPIVRHGVLVGLIPAPDLEFALDKLEEEDETLCLMATNINWAAVDEDEQEPEPDPSDLTPYIDPAPVALETHSPMDLVYQCFVKLGLRYMCVLQDGQFAGLVHKKTFVKYVRELDEDERKW